MENLFRMGQTWRMGKFMLQWVEKSLRSCRMVICCLANLQWESHRGKFHRCLIYFSCACVCQFVYKVQNHHSKNKGWRDGRRVGGKDGLVWMQNFIDNFWESWDSKNKRENGNSGVFHLINMSLSMYHKINVRERIVLTWLNLFLFFFLGYKCVQLSEIRCSYTSLDLLLLGNLLWNMYSLKNAFCLGLFFVG